ncbi:MAG: hypothetical protein AB8G95_23375 [Anaerolineae bacterium]
MRHQESTNYHDETYYLFNNALNSYMSHLQKIFNRGMIEAWIVQENVKNLSPWSVNDTLKYFEQLPIPDPSNETEGEIWMAGFNSTQPQPRTVQDVAEIFKLPVTELEIVG